MKQAAQSQVPQGLSDQEGIHIQVRVASERVLNLQVILSQRYLSDARG